MWMCIGRNTYPGDYSLCDVTAVSNFYQTEMGSHMCQMINKLQA